MHRKAGSFVEEFVRCIVRGSTSALASTVELTFWNGLDTQADTPTVTLRTHAYAIKSSALTIEEALLEVLFDLECKLGCEWDDRWVAQALVAFAGVLRTLAEIGVVVSGFEGPVEVGRHKGPRFRVSFHSFCGCYTVDLHFFGTTRHDCVFFSSGGETMLEALEMTVAKVLAASD